MDTIPYVVKQGDYLTRLAFERGLSAEEVWDSPKNAGLRDRRESMDVLSPGDIVHFPVPSQSSLPGIEPGQTNPYVARVPMVRIRVRVMDHGRVPVANATYKMTGMTQGIVGKTDSDGFLDAEVNVFVREARVSFEERRFVLAIRVGHMDPIVEHRGIVKRLKHLGFLNTAHGITESGLSSAITRFQQQFQLPITGRADDVTVQRIVEEHGA